MLRTVVLTLVLLLPAGLGAAGDVAPAVVGHEISDPWRDELTCVAIFVCARVCHDPAIDLRYVKVSSDGTTLRVDVTVTDIDGGWMCPEPAIYPMEGLTVRTFFQNCGGACGPSLVVFREGARVGTGVPGLGVHGRALEQCYIVENGPRQCGTGSVNGDTISWNVPLKTNSWDLRTACFDTVFAQGMAVPDAVFSASYLAAAAHDFADYRRTICMS